MNILRSFFAIAALAFVTITALSGCTTTRTENGVQIKESRSYNPLDYIPW